MEERGLSSRRSLAGEKDRESGASLFTSRFNVQDPKAAAHRARLVTRKCSVLPCPRAGCGKSARPGSMSGEWKRSLGNRVTPRLYYISNLRPPEIARACGWRTNFPREPTRKDLVHGPRGASFSRGPARFAPTRLGARRGNCVIVVGRQTIEICIVFSQINLSIRRPSLSLRRVTFRQEGPRAARPRSGRSRPVRMRRGGCRRG